jgi:hypothetical protein
LRFAPITILSVEDRFIGTPAMNAGVPDAVKQLSVLFPYGDFAAAAHRADLAKAWVRARRPRAAAAGVNEAS